jgi:hypothetical protein
VRCFVTPKNNFPFADSEVRWLGRIDPARPEIQKAQGYFLLPLDAEARAGGLKLAGVFAPGEFELTDDGVVATAPAGNVPSHSGVRTDYDHNRKSERLTVRAPSLAIATSYDGGRRAVHVFRDDKGDVITLRSTWSSASPFGLLVVYSLPTGAVRFGLGRVAPLEFEFLVRPPEIPGLKKTPVGL